MEFDTYIEYLLSNNDIIYIDTSSVMFTKEFRRFIECNYNMFINLNKRLTITREVCLEIVKHYMSTFEEKYDKAKMVLSILKQFQEIFIIEGDTFNTEEIQKAFADSELLARITKTKPQYRQLLITNDKGLSIDADSLNGLNLCKGKRIMVCYIDENGNLNRGKTAIKQEVQVDQNSVSYNETLLKDDKVSQKQFSFSKVLKICLYVTGVFLLGVIAGRYVK